MRYNKQDLIGTETIRKNRVFQTGSSPRDIQNRIRQRSQQPQLNSDLVTELKLKIERLEAIVSERSLQVVEKEVVSGYTEEEFDAELVKALEVEMNKFDERLKTETALVVSKNTQIVEYKETIKNQKNKLTSLNSEVVVLKAQLESANVRITDKDSVIEDLRTRPVQVVSGEVVVDPERPIMDTVVIDPNESDALSKLEDNISVEDVSITERENISNKVDKLKALLGGLKG